MAALEKHMVKLDHLAKVSGKAQYVADLSLPGLLTGRLLRSIKAKAVLREIKVPALPQGYYIVDAHDVPGENYVSMVDNRDTCIFADGKVEFIGEPILMVVGPEEKVVDQIIKSIVVDYQEEQGVFNALESDTVFYQFENNKGDTAKAFREADKIFTEKYYTGYQEHIYLETQGMIAYYEGRVLVIRGSMQCPYYLVNAVKIAMGITDNSQVKVQFDYTGGAFGGKEDYPSVLACQTAVATKKAGHPVRVVLERQEDIISTSKRHPAYMTYKTAVKNGRITGMDIDLIYDSGAYKTLSLVVLQRGIIGTCGVYLIDNLHVLGRAMKTNTTPNGAFRGFGGPQVFFAMEMHMTHLAKELGQDPLAFKKAYMVKQGDATSTNGKYHFPVVLPEMLDKIEIMSDYAEKYKAYSQPQTGRYRKGIGLSMAYHGAGFTGNGERDLIKAVMKVIKYEDDRVEILAVNTDMGQGIRTTFCKIASAILGIPAEEIIYTNPNTGHVPDSGPTVASRSMMNVGKLLERACLKLKAQWQPGVRQEFEERYQQPDFLIPWDLATFSGDAYPTYAWSVNVVEVKVDTLTGAVEVPGAWGVYDIGHPIDEAICRGQMEGGFLQGIGYGGMEQMTAHNGKLNNTSLSDYIIPTAMDVPHLEVAFVDNPYPYGPFGAKGAGELPAVGGAPAYVEAVENALDTRLYKTPVSMEDIMEKEEVPDHDK